MKHIIICADDYGQNHAISQGIIALISQHRLNAVSCMANANFWPEHATWLHSIQEPIDIGLHFNLTEGRPISEPYRTYAETFPSLKKIIFQAVSRQLKMEIIAAELRAQLDEFSNRMNGRAPDFIDGHQHIHQLPVIREALLQVYAERFRSKKVYIRCCVDKMSLYQPALLKRFIIQALGAQALKRSLDRAQIPYNSSFSGIYSFDQAEHYSTLFPQFLAKTEDRGMIMCHPGLRSEDAADPISAARYHEYQYLIGDQFLADCQAKRISLLRL